MFRSRLTGFAMLLAAGAAMADDITGKNRFVCTAWDAVNCTTERTCEHTEAWRLNLPDFLKVDLDAKEFTTLPGSEVTRYAAIDNIARSEGRIILSGHQGARGYSWVINESTGEGTITIVSDTTSLSAFVVCAATDVMN